MVKEIAGEEGMTLCRSLLDGIEDDGDADLQGRVTEGRCTGQCVRLSNHTILHSYFSSMVNAVTYCLPAAVLSVQCAWPVRTKTIARRGTRSYCATAAMQRRT